MNNPGEKHMEAVYRIKRYLKLIHGNELMFRKKKTTRKLMFTLIQSTQGT